MWEQIRSNQIRSVVLVVGMGGLLVAIGFLLGATLLGSGIAGLIIAFVIWLIMSAVAFFQGDNILLSISRAKKISRDDHPRLYNVVEEMKIASGLESMPDIYIIDDHALNAFAAGRNPNRASVAITSGLLEKLNRAELQGVIAHEISHIRNRDVLLMSICGVLLGTIVILAWYASRMLFFSGMTGGSRRRSSSSGGSAQIVIMAVGLALMILAPIFAQLIYFAVSRRREYLADASAVLYTRYPEGLASALEKLAGSVDQVKTANQALAPMYIVNPFRKSGRPATDLTSTHPPVSERIRILRSMASGASLADYEKAYNEVRGSGNRVIPASALSGPTIVPIQEPAISEADPDKPRLPRDTSDLLWKLNHYSILECDCGTRLKIPPNYRDDALRCPHCGTANRIVRSG
jgi:heat shock protein HtpX